SCAQYFSRRHETSGGTARCPIRSRTSTPRRRTGATTRMFSLLDAALLTTIILVADRVPSFDVAANGRRVASEAAPIGDPLASLREEQEARAQLVAQWTQCSAADRSYCRELTT